MKKLRKNKNGMTLIEVMLVVFIFSVMIMGMYAMLRIGEVSWFDADTDIDLQQSVRKVLLRMTREIRESGYNKDSVAQITIFDGTGFNGTDVVRFSIPVVCESGTRVIDSNGDIAYWRAPLTWGCTGSTCMDADNDCTTVDYQYVSYRVNNSNQLVRQVLDDSAALVREDIFAQDITDLQLQLNGNIVTVQVTAQKTSAVGRVLTSSEQLSVYLRNPG